VQERTCSAPLLLVPGEEAPHQRPRWLPQPRERGHVYHDRSMKPVLTVSFPLADGLRPKFISDPERIL
jgi:hypothetical protein